MASIRDVAKIAGVSPATVSRVMNGTANVDAEKRQRVYDAIRKTGFVPNEVARSLFKKSAKLIGLIIPSITNPFFTELADAVEKAADESGFRVVYYNTDNNPEKEKNAVGMLKSMNADGIIITSNNEELIDVIDKSGMSVVMIDRNMSSESTYTLITSDHYYGGRLAAQCLIDSGCKDIVCIRGEQSISSARERFLGFSDVCTEKGLKIGCIDCEHDFTFEGDIVTAIMKVSPQADGVFACNDMMALSLYKQLTQKEIKVPQDISIVGFDNVMLSKLVTPEITTISQPIDKMGRMAVKLITGEQISQKAVVYKPELIKRETTK
ncbi:MAG: LacI family DNA-binding transcriptional regulator [Eubacteriales bacterium]|nr:LacI family DNA-binding transcriptional regulator [Eubacteriales bacterium]